MEIAFNELSVVPLLDTETEIFKRVETFIKTYKKAQEEGFKGIRFYDSIDKIMLSPTISLYDFCLNPSRKIYATIILGSMRHPFIDENSEEEEKYINNNFTLVKDKEQIPVIGFAVAYLYNTICISFQSTDFWKSQQYHIHIEGEHNQDVIILSCSHETDFTAKYFLEWKQDNIESDLIETTLASHEKEIKLRDDHGKDLLMFVAKKICQSPYVKGIINSLPYNPRKSNIIHKISPMGIIEFVLTNTDQGLGLVVKTTGRNLKETRIIAHILKEKYFT